MSAIFGIYNLKKGPVAPFDLQKMSEDLRAHGPDGGGTWLGDSIGIGQHLMCFTPEDRLERQPESIIDGLKIVADARLDNRPELMELLKISASEAAQLPDSAFIALAWEKWHTGCARYLVGEFAFAIWDERIQTLFLSRSPFGGRPLCTHSTAETFAFATLPSALLSLPFAARALDEENLADFLVGVSRTPDSTLFQGVSHLLPGHSLVLSQGARQTERFWQADPKRKIRYAKDSDYIEAFGELFDRVIGDNLRSLTPVGVLMSGGLDSSSVGATAAILEARAGKRVSSFTEVPRAGFASPMMKGRYADETPLVEAIARQHSNLDLNFIRTQDRTLLGDLDSFFAHSQTPVWTAANRLWWEAALETAAQQNVRVMLTGDGGNLTVSWGGSELLKELLRSGQWKRAWREAQASVRQGDERSARRTFLSQGILRLLPPRLLLTLLKRRDGDPAKEDGSAIWNFSPINREFANSQNLSGPVRDIENQSLALERYNSTRWRYWLMTQVRFSGIEAGHRARFGVDTRNPLRDQRIIEFCLALPEEQCRRNGETRWLIRRAMQNRLPVEVMENKQRGLQASDWFDTLNDSRAEIEAKLQEMEADPLACRVLEMPLLRRLVDEWPESQQGDPDTLESYRSVFQAGLVTGAFIRWFEQESPL